MRKKKINFSTYRIYFADESFSICTEASVTTQESNLVDSNTMTTHPESLERVGLRSESEGNFTQIIFLFFLFTGLSQKQN